MSRKSIEEKIGSIVSDRQEVVTLLRKSLIDNCTTSSELVEELLNNMEDLDQTSRKYKSLLKVKKLISDLTGEIVLASSLDDIKKLRNKLNYHLNKFKKELESRNIDDTLLNGSVELIRDDIKEYIRYSKRQENVSKILDIYHKGLTREEKKELNKLSNNEIRFNQRLKEKYTNPRFVKTREKYSSKPTELKEIKSPEIVEEKAASIVEAVPAIYINSKMLRENTHYVLTPIREYVGSLFENIKRLFINLPGYLHNKRILKLMKSDYNNFYSGKNLKELINLVETNNSLSQALETIVRKTKLGKILKGTEEYNQKIDRMNQEIDIMEEYKKRVHERPEKSEIEFSSLGIKQFAPEVVEDGTIDFEPIKRLSTK